MRQLTKKIALNDRDIIKHFAVLNQYKKEINEKKIILFWKKTQTRKIMKKKVLSQYKKE